MTNSNLTAAAIVIDRSGSMRSIAAATQDGLNEFFNARRLDPTCGLLHVAQFDDLYEQVFSGPAADFGGYELSPRGTTALHDAIGRTVNELGVKLAAIPEDQRPGNVLFAIMTDGHENSSREFTADQVRDMIAHQRDAYRWQFLYLGANQDAVLVAQRDYGLGAHNSMTYAASAGGTRSASRTLGETYVAAAAGAPIRVTDAQRRAAMEREGN